MIQSIPGRRSVIARMIIASQIEGNPGINGWQKDGIESEWVTVTRISGFDMILV